jgi:hypothetical protein
MWSPAGSLGTPGGLGRGSGGPYTVEVKETYPFQDIPFYAYRQATVSIKAPEATCAA